MRICKTAFEVGRMEIVIVRCTDLFRFKVRALDPDRPEWVQLKSSVKVADGFDIWARVAIVRTEATERLNEFVTDYIRVGDTRYDSAIMTALDFMRRPVKS